MHHSDHEVRAAHNELTARFDQVRTLGWPLTARDFQPLYNLARRMIGQAEDYLEAGEMTAAMQSIVVGDTACGTLSAMHALETMED